MPTLNHQFTRRDSSGLPWGSVLFAPLTFHPDRRVTHGAEIAAHIGVDGVMEAVDIPSGPCLVSHYYAGRLPAGWPVYAYVSIPATPADLATLTPYPTPEALRDAMEA